MTFRPGRRVRDPAQFSLRLAGVGLMLGRPMRSSKPQDLGQTNPQFGYDGQNPVLGQTHLWRSLDLGMGLPTQEGKEDRRSKYAINADTSVPGLLAIQGPAVTAVTPSTTDATNGIGDFFEIAGSLYALAGRYALKREGDLAANWTVSKDFTSGKASLKAKTFYTNAGSGANYAYVAMGDAEFFYRFEGTTWTQHASLYARDFAVVGRDFYRGHATNTLAFVDTDTEPWTAANWTNPNSFSVGDKSSGIVSLAVNAAGVLVVLKQDGVYTIQGRDDAQPGEDRRFFPFTSFATTSDNAKFVAAFRNDLYFTYGNGFYRLTPDFELVQCGPELLLGNSSEVKGRVTAAASDNFHLYVGVYNVDSGHSYVMKWDGLTWDEGRRVPAWHGSITSKFTSKKITAMRVSTVGADSGHSRMYLGFSDGTPAWFQLSCQPSPLACSNYDFSTTDGEVYLPANHFGYPGGMKAIQAYTVGANNLASTRSVEVEYRTDPTGSFTALGTTFDSGQRERVEMTNSASATTLDTKLILNNSSASATPQVTDVEVEFQLRTPLEEVYEWYVLAEDGLFKHDGTPMRIGQAEIVEVCEQAANATGSLTAVTLDGSTRTVAVIGFDRTVAYDERARRPRQAIKLTAVQVLSGTVYGTVDRTRAYLVGDTVPYLVGQTTTWP